MRCLPRCWAPLGTLARTIAVHASHCSQGRGRHTGNMHRHTGSSLSAHAACSTQYKRTKRPRTRGRGTISLRGVASSNLSRRRLAARRQAEGRRARLQTGSRDVGANRNCKALVCMNLLLVALLLGSDGRSPARRHQAHSGAELEPLWYRERVSPSFTQCCG